MTTDPRLADGRTLFLAGRYFDAHEVWEHLWRACPPADRRFVQALIHAAVALYQRERGNETGARTQLERARRKAAEYPPGYLGFDTRPVWERVEAVFGDPGGGRKST